MQTQTETSTKIVRTYTIEPSLYKKVKKCANKDARIISKIIERYLMRYVESKS